ncbi:MAG: hemin-degrading factor [Herbaspirillum sp.]|jgi:putative hemin transport protein|nr:hemin-degrading factor [Herbaspirillum sp.]
MKNTDSLTAAQRLATGIPHRVIRLKGPFSALLCRVHEIGIVTILSGNESAIQESVGIYDHMAYQNNAESDATQASSKIAHQPLFYQKWKYGFAVSDKDDDGNIRRHLQFFDGNGNGIYKILLHASSNVDAYRAIARDFAAVEQAPVLDIFRTKPITANEGIDRIDIDALRADWARINDTEDFFARQTEFDSLRLHKLRLAGKAFAHQVANDSVHILLQKMADLGSTVMALVGNAGIVQAYQGHVKQLRSSDAWLNILSQDRRLRLREDHIDTVWVAKKPTTDGIVTSLELFNRQGISIARFFSKPEPGRPEPREWRDSIMRLLPVFGG